MFREIFRCPDHPTICEPPLGQYPSNQEIDRAPQLLAPDISKADPLRTRPPLPLSTARIFGSVGPQPRPGQDYRADIRAILPCKVLRSPWSSTPAPPVNASFSQSDPRIATPSELRCGCRGILSRVAWVWLRYSGLCYDECSRHGGG